MGLKNSAALKKEFALLLNEGKSQKEAALIVGISEKTAGAWRKEMPFMVYSKQRKEIQKKISAALADKNSSASDVAKLADAAVKLEKCIDYAMNNPLQ